MAFIIVSFLKNYDEKFQGVDGKLYGPFTKGQQVALPASNARLLIKLGVAKEIGKPKVEPGLKEVFKGEVLTGFVEAARAKTLNKFREPSKEVKELIADVDELLAEMKAEEE